MVPFFVSCVVIEIFPFGIIKKDETRGCLPHDGEGRKKREKTGREGWDGKYPYGRHYVMTTKRNPCISRFVP